MGLRVRASSLLLALALELAVALVSGNSVAASQPPARSIARCSCLHSILSSVL
jgi:hypothetical protein